QPTNIFTGLAAGSHTIIFTDANGCPATVSSTVAGGSNISSTVSVFDPPCANSNNGTITVTPTSGTGPYQYSLNGSPLQSNNIFTGLAAGPYTINIVNAIGCTGT